MAHNHFVHIHTNRLTKFSAKLAFLAEQTLTATPGLLHLKKTDQGFYDLHLLFNQ